jgi:hypothetical protein
MDLYSDFISDSLKKHFIKDAKAYPEIDGLRHLGASGGLENKRSMEFLLDLFKKVSPELKQVLRQRRLDREFLDQRTRALAQYNSEHHRAVTSNDYKTVLGLEDKEGRIVVGPLRENYWTFKNDFASNKRADSPRLYFHSRRIQ